MVDYCVYIIHNLNMSKRVVNIYKENFQKTIYAPQILGEDGGKNSFHSIFGKLRLCIKTTCATSWYIKV